jgi:hypothetical protein
MCGPGASQVGLFNRLLDEILRPGLDIESFPCRRRLERIRGTNDSVISGR